MSEIIKKERTEVDFDWLDSNTLILDSNKELRPAGTAIKINNHIIFLSPLTNEQLLNLKDAVTSAVEYELKKRISNNTI